MTESPSRSNLLTWLQLMRLPTVFTALADIFCGYCISHPGITLTELPMRPSFPWLLLSSAGLYLSGMVLNDVFDARLDAIERPERPIPSGRISRNAATLPGVALMAIGLIAAWVADHAAGPLSRSLVTAGTIAATVIAYNAVLKKTFLGPAGMAACRFLNLQLGASTAGYWATSDAIMSESPTINVAAALAVYILGVTSFARHETGKASPVALWIGLIVAAAALLLNINTALTYGPHSGVRIIAGMQLMLLASIMFRMGRTAIQDGTPRRLQQMVGKLLLGIIVLDAVMAYAITGSILLEATILLLIVPAVILRKRIAMS